MKEYISLSNSFYSLGIKNPLKKFNILFEKVVDDIALLAHKFNHVYVW